jgi:hypothetical protein
MFTILKSEIVFDNIEEINLKDVQKQINNNNPNIGLFSELCNNDISNIAFDFSHCVLEDNKLYVDIKILSTPNGIKLLQRLDELDKDYIVKSKAVLFNQKLVYLNLFI